MDIEHVIHDEILRVEPHVDRHLSDSWHQRVPRPHRHALCGDASYLELHGPDRPWLQRLAFFTVVAAPAEFPWHVNVTAPGEIDCAFQRDRLGYGSISQGTRLLRHLCRCDRPDEDS